MLKWFFTGEGKWKRDGSIDIDYFHHSSKQRDKWIGLVIKLKQIEKKWFIWISYPEKCTIPHIQVCCSSELGCCRVDGVVMICGFIGGWRNRISEAALAGEVVGWALFCMKWMDSIQMKHQQLHGPFNFSLCWKDKPNSLFATVVSIPLFCSAYYFPFHFPFKMEF